MAMYLTRCLICQAQHPRRVSQMEQPLVENKMHHSSAAYDLYLLSMPFLKHAPNFTGKFYIER